MTKHPILISFCIPTYNRANYLRCCIESIIGYQYDDIEIIISDNCSTDITPDVVKEYSDSRIRYFRNPTNIGARLNVRAVIDHAQGKYIFYLTDDDVLVPGAVSIIKEFILNHDVSVFRSDLLVFLEKSRKATYISNVKKTGPGNALSIKEKSEIIRHSSVLSVLCFKKDDFDFTFYDKNIELWYPSTLITGYLSNKMGYLTKPIVIHTWENKIFWGISDRSKELLISQVKGLIILKDKIEPDLYNQLVKSYMIDKRKVFYKLIISLSVKEKILLFIIIYISNFIKLTTRTLSFCLTQIKKHLK